MTRTLVALLAFVAAASAQEASVQLTALFSDHMVLPANTAVVVRGRSVQGDGIAIEASWLDQRIRGEVAADGSFAVALPTPDRGGPHRFTVTNGASRRLVDDVLVGDVWLASGQSNMEMSLGPSPTGPRGCANWERDSAAAADLPQLRLFTVARHVAAAPQTDVQGEWRVCSPESAKTFSGVAFHFGADLARRGKGPIGVVASSWGGTVCEAWTRAEGLRAFPEFANAVSQLAEEGGQALLQKRREAFWRAVEEKAESATGGGAATLPHVWSKHGLDGHDGLGVYRREVDVPAAWAGSDLVLMLGAIDDMDLVRWDGERIAGTEQPGHWNEARHYRVPAAKATAGRHRLEVLVLDTGGEGGIGGSAESCRIQPASGDGGGFGLDADWTFGKGCGLRELPRLPDSLQSNPNVPTVLWNGMVAGLLPFPFTGAIWYQGESNRGRAVQYAELFPAMIRDWRASIGTDLPFVFVQIAPYGYGGDKGELFALRLAQEKALSLPRVGMAVTTDVGDVGDIHPRDKSTVGQRLAMQARHLHYGEPADALLPPRARRAVADGATVRLEVEHATAWSAGGDGRQPFELAGSDGVFRPATLRVEGAVLVLVADGVAEPKHVRHAFAATAMASLVDQRGLPLPPFALEVESKGS